MQSGTEPDIISVAEMMKPRAVAIIGASEDTKKFGGRILHATLKQGFSGKIYPINPNRDSLLGLKAYSHISQVDGPVDLAIMAIPKEYVLETLGACGDAGVRSMIVITSGFSEAGDEGAALEAAMVQCAREKRMRLVGPNCIGIYSPQNAFALSAAPMLLESRPYKGHIGFISQSGAIMGTVVDRATRHRVGFTHCVSVGNQADLDLCDFVDFLIEDPATRVIFTYIEGIKRPERFVASAKRAQLSGKPWLMLKSGQTAEGAAAAFSHTASMASDQAVLESLCNHYGVIMMDDIEASLLAAAGLARYPAMHTDSVAVMSPSGGGCAVATDRLVKAGIPLSRFTPKTQTFLDGLFNGQARNPIDIGAANDGAAMSYTEEIHRAVLADDNVGMAITMMTVAPNVTRFAQMTANAVVESNKPSLVVLLPGDLADGARAIYNENGMLYTETLATGLRALQAWRSWSNRPAAENPERPDAAWPSPPSNIAQLGEEEVKTALAGAGIVANAGRFAATPAQCAAAASKLNAPYVLKIVSEDIVHKTDVGGVILNLADSAAVENAAQAMLDRIQAKQPDARLSGFLVQEQIRGELELVMGLKHDAQFGMMIVVGAGGVLTELLHDIAIAPCPITPATAHRLLNTLKIAPLYQGVRGGPALDIPAVVDTLVRLSWLGHDWRHQLLELDLNPVLVKPLGQGCIAVDGRALGTGAEARAGSE